VVEVDPDRFQELVAEALDGIPPDLGGLMDNVNVFVNDHRPPGSLLGLYEGVPLTQREAYGGLVLPDRITIFRQSICAICESEEEVRQQVRVTVVHEVAHHFGIDDRRLEELGWG
jgi:predicted Zn-dependent protease with MMP-like domain